MVVVACVSSDGYMAGHQRLHSIDSGVITVLHDSYSSMRQAIDNSRRGHLPLGLGVTHT
jgi:hypothetical protein